jgi:GTPase Era involved in 16S rRNA processing
MDDSEKNNINPEAQNENEFAGKINPVADLVPDLEHLRSYSNLKLALADLLRISRQAFVVLGRDAAENNYRELMVKLAEDRFTLAVLGQFKRGKSSLMNAIIGKELLPTGVLPLTSVITILKYGPAERLVLHRENALYPAELPISELPDYVTEKGNPHNQKKIKAAYVELPVPFLRYGIEFVDTPGVGSAISANTETTYKFLPECDAVLFVTSVDTPMTDTEVQFLRNIKDYSGRIFFIVNKIDLILKNEQEEIIRFVTETIQATLGDAAVKVFPVSSRLAITARTENNESLYEQSRLKDIEDSLAAFLTEEKSFAFLASTAQKGLRILSNEMEQHIFTEEYLQNRAQTIAQEKRSKKHNDPRSALMTLTNIKAKLEALYNSVSGKPAAERNDFRTESEEKESPAETVSVVPDINNEAIDIKTDLETRGCPVCEHIAGQAFDFFAHWQYQVSANEKAQNEFAEELAFCPLHSWQLLAISSPQGASVGYAKLADKMAYLLKTQKDFFKDGNTLKNLVHHSGNCRVCSFLREVEEKYIDQLVVTLQEKESQVKYLHSQGLCLWHLGMLIDKVPTDELKDFLLSYEAKLFEQDAEDMRSFSLKNEALRRGLQNINEKDAYMRTMIRIVGERSVCVPWAQDGEI